MEGLLQEAQIIDGKRISLGLREELKQKIAQLSRAPELAVVLVGDNPASLIYVKNKKKMAEEVGINVQFFHLSPVITQDALKEFIYTLNKNEKIDGILVQMPLPKHLDSEEILDIIDPNKDVDGLTTTNLGKLFIGKPSIIPCTPKGCMVLLKTVCPKLTGLRAIVIGRSRLVGKPLAQLLLLEDMTVTLAHSKTKDLKNECLRADVIVSATGFPKLINKDFVKKGAVLIDVGIHRAETGKIVGDIDLDSVMDLAKAVTPVPGGVGPMTITMLLTNVTQMCIKKLDAEMKK